MVTISHCTNFGSIEGNYKLIDKGLTVEDRGLFSRQYSEIRVAEGNQIITDGNSADMWASAANRNINYGANNYSNLPSILGESGEGWLVLTSPFRIFHSLLTYSMEHSPS